MSLLQIQGLTDRHNNQEEKLLSLSVNRAQIELAPLCRQTKRGVRWSPSTLSPLNGPLFGVQATFLKAFKKFSLSPQQWSMSPGKIHRWGSFKL